MYSFDYGALFASPVGVIALIAVVFVTIVFLSQASKRRARDRERHLRALEAIARSQHVADPREQQRPGDH